VGNADNCGIVMEKIKECNGISGCLVWKSGRGGGVEMSSEWMWDRECRKVLRHSGRFLGIVESWQKMVHYHFEITFLTPWYSEKTKSVKFECGIC